MSDPERRKPDIASVRAQISREQLASLPSYLGLNILPNPSTQTILATGEGNFVNPIQTRLIHIGPGTTFSFDAYRGAITPYTLLLRCNAYGTMSVDNPVPILVVEFIHPSTLMPSEDAFSGALQNSLQFNFIPAPYSRETTMVPIGWAPQEWVDVPRELTPSVFDAILVFAPWQGTQGTPRTK